MHQLPLVFLLVAFTIGLKSSKTHRDESPKNVVTTTKTDDCICVVDKQYTRDCKCGAGGAIVKANCTRYKCSDNSGGCSDGCESCYVACERERSEGVYGGGAAPAWSTETNKKIDIYKRPAGYLEFGAQNSPRDNNVEFHGFKLDLYTDKAVWEANVKAISVPSQCRVFFRFYDAHDQFINRFPINSNEFIETNVDQVSNQQRFFASQSGNVGRWQDVAYGYMYFQSRPKN